MAMKFRGFLRPEPLLVCAIIMAFIITVGLSIWSRSGHLVFDSPDALVNYHFSRFWSETGTLTFPASGVPGYEYVVPRSAKVAGASIVPAGFWGLPFFYGSLNVLFPSLLLPYWTLIFAVIGLLAWYWLWKKVWSIPAAIIILALTAFHPAWWYYSFRSLLPNVLFCSLVMIASLLWYQFLNGSRRCRWTLTMASLVTSLALIVRPSEIIWLAPVVAFVIYRQKISRTYWFGLAVGLLALILIWLAINSQVYGQLAAFAYNLQALPGKSLWLPFGFHPRLIWNTVWNYGFTFFLAHSLLAIVGLYVILRSSNAWRNLYFTSVLIISVVLPLYYGSWILSDNPEPGAVTIGSSFVRYFLPIYILLTPAIAAVLLQTGKWVGKFQYLVAGVVIVVLMLVSSGRVLYQPGEGVISLRQELCKYQSVGQQVVDTTEPEAIILTPRSDKLIWPYRRVITPSGDDGYLRAIPGILKEGVPVYYLHLPLSDQGRQELQSDWSQYGFTLGPEIWQNQSLALYRLQL